MLTASPSDPYPTQYTTLTATASANVGPTPWFIRIYDRTTSQYVASCGVGTTCSLGITEPTASYQVYVAFIDDGSNLYPPSNLQATSADQPVQWQYVWVSLQAAGPTTLPTGANAPFTVTGTNNLASSPFTVSYYDPDDPPFQPTFLGECFGLPTPCQSTLDIGTNGTYEMEAYVGAPFSLFGTIPFPPPGIVATSFLFFTNTSSTWQASLTGPGAVANGSPGTYTATTNADVGPTPYYIEIFDATTNTELAICGWGTTCSATYASSSDLQLHTIVAFVSDYTTSISAGIVGIGSSTQASSNPVDVFNE
jgi:hypothetical protein